MKATQSNTLVLTLASLAFTLHTLTAAPFGTAFTYQGRLQTGANPANGQYDFAFTNFDAITGGSQVGPGLTTNGVSVSNGLFIVSLDFSNSFNSGAASFLQIGVRTNGAGAFSVLNPRQALTPTPYAITSSNLAGTLSASQLSGAVGSAQLSGTYSGAVTFNNPADSFLGSFTGNGANLTNVNALFLCGQSCNNFWNLFGNGGTTPGVNFLGTTDNKALELKVNLTRALRVEPTLSTPNLIGGYSGNSVAAGSVGAVVGGGGASGQPNAIFSDFDTVSGGAQNAIGAAPYATIAGGTSNTLGDLLLYGFADYSAIGGGFGNLVRGSQVATIAGGGTNRIIGGPGSISSFAAIGGGGGNLIDGGNFATIAGGEGNLINALCGRGTIGGGSRNQNGARFGTIGGGVGNLISASCDDGLGSDGSSILGGSGNYIFGANSAIGGGAMNRIDQPVQFSLDGACIGGGISNSVSGSIGTVGGGLNNRVTNAFGTVSGGQGNFAAGIGASVAGGAANQALLDFSSIGGGSNNTVAAALYGTIAGGCSNILGDPNLSIWAAPYSVIGGGSGNFVKGALNATIAGGLTNRIAGGFASSDYSSIGGGIGNNIDSGKAATISGGERNTINSLCGWGVIGGGFQNLNGGKYATIGGGYSNVITGDCDFGVPSFASCVSGGELNSLLGEDCTIAGGVHNTIDSSYVYINGATIGGGSGNLARFHNATVAGGANNSATNISTTVSGGSGNLAGAPFSTIPGGAQASASHYGQQAYASGQFAGIGDAQTSVYVCRNSTANATQTELFLDGTSQRMNVPPNSTWSFEVLITGRSSSGTSAGYQIRGTIKNMAGTVSLVGAPVFQSLGEDVAAWDSLVTADNVNKALSVMVVGAASTNIRWVASVRTTEVTY